MPEDVLAQLLRRVAALERRVAATFRVGRVAAVQDRPYRVSVELAGGVTTGPLHVFVPRSGPSMIDFSPLEVGEGVGVFAPGGDDSVMFVLPSLATGRIDLVAGDADTRFMSGKLLVGDGVEVTGGDLEVADGDAAVSGNLTAAGVSDQLGALDRLRSTYNAHTHPIPSGQSGPPIQQD